MNIFVGAIGGFHAQSSGHSGTNIISRRPVSVADALVCRLKMAQLKHDLRGGLWKQAFQILCLTCDVLQEQNSV